MNLSISHPYINKVSYCQNVNFRGINASSGEHLKSQAEIQNIIEHMKYRLNDCIRDFDKTQRLYYMVRDSIDNRVNRTNYAILWMKIHNNISNAWSILTEILMDEKSQNKNVEDLINEMIEKLEPNEQQKGSQYKTNSNMRQDNNPPKVKKKSGWTEQQFLNHIIGVVSARHFKTGQLKDSEIRNLAKLFNITVQQVKIWIKKPTINWLNSIILILTHVSHAILLL